jgi:hypothetical protein
MNIQEWLNKTFHITNAESAPIMITLIVFIVGGAVTWFSRFISNIAGRNAIRKQFYHLTQSMIASSFIQAEKYKETAGNFTLKDVKPLVSSAVDFYQPAIVKDLGYLKIFESMFEGIENRFIFRIWNRRSKLDAFYDCWNAFFSAQVWQDRANADIRIVLDNYNRLNESRNKGMFEFEKITYTLYQSIVGLPQAEHAKTYYNDVMRIKNNWAGMNDYVSPKVSYDHLVKPILDLSMNNTFEGAQMIRFVLMEVEADYVNMDRMMGVYRQQFMNYADYLTKHAERMLSGMNTIR